MCATGVRLKKENTKRGNRARQERGKDWASRLLYFEVDLGSVRHESLKGVVAGVLTGFWPLSYFFLLLAVLFSFNSLLIPTAAGFTQSAVPDQYDVSHLPCGRICLVGVLE